MHFEEWLADFSKGKRLVATFAQSQLDALYNAQRYIMQGRPWTRRGLGNSWIWSAR